MLNDMYNYIVIFFLICYHYIEAINKN